MVVVVVYILGYEDVCVCEDGYLRFHDSLCCHDGWSDLDTPNFFFLVGVGYMRAWTSCIVCSMHKMTPASTLVLHNKY